MREKFPFSSICIACCCLNTSFTFLHVTCTNETHGGIQSASFTLNETETREVISLGDALPTMMRFLTKSLTAYGFVSIYINIHFLFWNFDKWTFRILFPLSRKEALQNRRYSVRKGCACWIECKSIYQRCDTVHFAGSMRKEGRRQKRLLTKVRGLVVLSEQSCNRVLGLDFNKATQTIYMGKVTPPSAYHTPVPRGKHHIRIR